jgi:hypothetical protein
MYYAELIFPVVTIGDRYFTSDAIGQEADANVMVAEELFEHLQPVSFTVITRKVSGDSYKNFLLDPIICMHGWACQIHTPESEILTLTPKTCSWESIDAAKALIDIDFKKEACNKEFYDYPIKIGNPFIKLIKFNCFDLDETQQYVMFWLALNFGKTGKNSFWEEFLIKFLEIPKRKLRVITKNLEELGLITTRHLHKFYPIEYFLGPAWLAVDDLKLNTQELEAIVEGSRCNHNIPYYDRTSFRGSRLRHENKSIIFIPENPLDRWYSLKWENQWIVQRKRDEKSEFEPPMPVLDYDTTRIIVDSVNYGGYTITTYGIVGCIYADIWIDQKKIVCIGSFEELEDVITWAKKSIDLSDERWWKTHKNCLRDLDAFIQDDFRDREIALRLMQHLLSLMGGSGTCRVSEYFLSQGLGITSRKLLNIQKSLSASGWINIGWRTVRHETSYYIGPACLNVTELNSDEAFSLMMGEHICNKDTAISLDPSRHYSKDFALKPKRTGDWIVSASAEKLLRENTYSGEIWQSTWSKAQGWQHFRQAGSFMPSPLVKRSIE